MLSRTLGTIGLGICGALVAVTAGAADIIWDFASSTQNATNSGNFGNSRDSSSGGVTATASAWSNTTNSSNTVIQDAYLGLYGNNGLGVTNRDGAVATSSTCGSITGGGDICEGAPSSTISPEHAVDNNQRYDAIRISFGSTAVNLSGVAIGYKGNDADISVLASNGVSPSGKVFGTYGGSDPSQLTQAGWTLIGNYSNLQADDSVPLTWKSLGTSTFATEWLFVAYNPTAFGTACSDSGGTPCQLDNNGNDAFKLRAVTGNTRQVPEPGTALLFAVALAGIWAGRRRARYR